MCMFSRSLFVLLAIVLSVLLIIPLISSNSSHPSGAPQFNHCFSGVPITRSYVLCVCFIDRCLYFFFWSLYCLSFDLRLLITPLVSSHLWPLYCLSFDLRILITLVSDYPSGSFGYVGLSFFDLRTLIIPLVSSNSSYGGGERFFCMYL